MDLETVERSLDLNKRFGFSFANFIAGNKRFIFDGESFFKVEKKGETVARLNGRVKCVELPIGSFLEVS